MEYRFKHLLRTSLNSYPNPALYRCHICGKIVGFLSKLQSHMSLHYDRSNPVQMFACYICDEKFKYRQVRFFFFLFVFWAAAPRGTKSCRTQEESVRPSVRPSVCPSFYLPSFCPGCPLFRIFIEYHGEMTKGSIWTMVPLPLLNSL